MAAGSCWDWQEIWESSRLRSPEAQRMAVSRCGPCREECFGKKMGGFSHPRTPEPLLLCMENGCRTLLGVVVAAALPDKALLLRGDVQSHQRGLSSSTRPYSCFSSYRRVCQTQRMTSRCTGAFSELVVVWGGPSAVARWLPGTALKMLPVEHLSASSQWLQPPGVYGTEHRPHGPVFHGIPQPTGSWEGRGQRDKLLGWGRSPVFIERPPKPHRAGHHSSIPSSPWGRHQQPQAGRGDTLVPEQPGTYIDLTEDDIDDAADHDEEVKDVPGVPKVTLCGESQREEE